MRERNQERPAQNILITDTELNGTAFRTALRFQQNGREIRLEVQFYTVFTRWCSSCKNEMNVMILSAKDTALAQKVSSASCPSHPERH